jgi:hypothetical protein
MTISVINPRPSDFLFERSVKADLLSSSKEERIEVRS